MKQINLKRLLLIPLMIMGASFAALAQPMAGVYTVGGTSPDFATLAAAVSDLNSRGVSGPVWFKLRTGTYTSTTNWVGNIQSISGASATNRITFESETGNKADVTIQNANSSSVNYVFLLNSASYITIRNMTMRSTATSRGRIIRVDGTSSYDSVYNCTLDGNSTSSSTSSNMAVIYGNSTQSNNIVFHNNEIMNGSYGVLWYGAGTGSYAASNDVFANNIISGSYYKGIDAEYTSNITIRNNTISSQSTVWNWEYDGIYLYTCDNAMRVENNTINATTDYNYIYGVQLNYSSGSSSNAANRGSIKGNTINLNVTSYGYMYGVYSGYSNQYDSVVNNTLNLSTTYTWGGYQYGLHNEGYNTNMVFKGNTVNHSGNVAGLYNYACNYYCTNTIFDGNTINTNLSNNSSVYNNLYCIYAGSYSGGNDNTTLSNNTINANTAGYGTVYGIYALAYYSSNYTISGNTINTITTNTSSVYGNYGIYLYQYGGSGSTIEKNKVRAINSSTYNWAYTNALYMSSANNAKVRNNAFICKADYTNYNYAAAVTMDYDNNNIEFYNNSCSNIGNGGYAISIYHYDANLRSEIYRNNIFANMSNSNPALHLYYAPSVGLDMDYNNYYSKTTTANFSVVGVQYSGSYSTAPLFGGPLSTMRSAGFDKGSIAYNPGFTDSSSNLMPDASKPASWSVNGRGVHMSNNNKDILGATRVTTKPAGVPDLGAYEFTPTSTPPLAIATPAVPAASSTQYYTFGQDTVMVVNWPSTPTPPSSLDVRQYTGTIAPGISSLGSTYMYFYVDAQPTGTGPYTSDTRVYFKDPWTGTTAKTALRMAQRTTPSASWVAHPHSVSGVNATLNYIYHGSLTDFGELTGADIANNAGALAITAPTPRFCAGTYTLKAKIANLGNNTINSVQVNWTVDGGTPSSVSYTTPIPTMVAGNNEAEVTLGSITFTNKAKTIKIWTSNPNGVTDPVPGDDTVTLRWGPGMSGEYTVGGTAPDFATLTDALTDLNKFGVCAPVWFKVRDGNYTGQYNLANVDGMSTTNRVTIESQSGIAANVTMTSGTNVFRFNGASNYTLKNIGITATNSDGASIQLRDNSSYDSIVGCRIVVTGTSYPAYGIDMDGTGMSGSDLHVVGNTFVGGLYGVYIGNYDGYTMDNYTFENNTLTDYYYGGLYLYTYYSYVMNNFKVNGNYLSSVSTNGPDAITMEYAAGSLEIMNNTIVQPNGASGINNYDGDGSSSQHHKIANNSIVVGGTYTYSYGLYLSYCDYTDVYNNSVNYYGTGTTNATAAYLYLYYGTCNVYNNVFANTGGGPAMMPYMTSSGEKYDYNNLYATGTKLVQASNNSSLSYDSLTLYRNATGQDKNSISYDPGFMSQTNLMPDVNNAASWSLNGRGVHIAGNDKDINGNPRVVNRADGVPDIGAYEFVPATIPPLAKAFPATATAGTTQVFTFGQDTVARINWNANTVVPTNVEVRQYTGTIPPSFPVANHMYFYTDISSIPVTYILDADIFYKDPWTGKIPASEEGNIRMARKASTIAPWNAYADVNSTINTSRNVLSNTILTGLGYFTGIEKDSLFSANIRPMGPVVFCAGGSVTLQSGYSGSNYSYQWQLNGNNISGATSSSYIAVLAGDYSVRVTEIASGKTAMSEPVAVTIVSNPTALVTVNGPMRICTGNTVNLTSNTGSGLTYQWVRNGIDIPGETNPTYTATSGGSYAIKVKNVGCTNISAPVTIVQAPVSVDLGNDTSFCTRSPLNLDALNPGAKYTWSTGDTTQTISFNQYGHYKIWVHVDAGVNCIAKDTIDVTISPKPQVVGISSIRVSGDTYRFDPSGSQYVDNYLWILPNGSTDTSKTITHTYTKGEVLKLVVFNGCGSDTVSLDLTTLNVKDVTAGSEFSLYPNPAQEKVTLSVSGEAKFNDIVIVNSIGQVVLRQSGEENVKSRTINIQGLPDGHYLIRANTADGKIISKPFQIIR